MAYWADCSTNCSREGLATRRRYRADPSCRLLWTCRSLSACGLNSSSTRRQVKQSPAQFDNHYPLTPTRAQRNAYSVMETPPQWGECDGFICCRVNVAKALIAPMRAAIAAGRRNYAYVIVCESSTQPRSSVRTGTFGSNYPSAVAPLPRAAWAAARRAIGTRNGEHDT